MNNYPFTQDEMKEIWATDILDLALAAGFEIDEKHSSNDVVKLKDFTGLFVWTHGRGFYNHGSGKGGNVFAFAREYLGLSTTKEIGNFILGKREELEAIKVQKTKTGKEKIFRKSTNEKTIDDQPYFSLFSKNGEKAKNFLLRYRGVSEKIISRLDSQKKIQAVFSSPNGRKRYPTVAFLGRDENDNIKYCFIRSAYPNNSFKQEIRGSDKSYGFFYKAYSDVEPKGVYVFESPLDSIAHSSLQDFTIGAEDNFYRLSLGGTSDLALERFLKTHENIEEIVFCLDNDFQKEKNHGQIRAQEMKEKFSERGYKTSVEIPNGKDFSDDLVAFRKQRNRKGIKSPLNAPRKEIEPEPEGEWDMEI